MAMRRYRLKRKRGSKGTRQVIDVGSWHYEFAAGQREFREVPEIIAVRALESDAFEGGPEEAYVEPEPAEPAMSEET